MNCHHARQLISPYLDQQLTGREMLALQDHFAGCESCEGEVRSIRQLKSLLRGLHEPRPRRDLPGRIALRLEEPGRGGWHVLCLPPPRPQRGRRLATALALSCLTVLSFVAPFAPDARREMHSASSLFSPSGLSAVSPDVSASAFLLQDPPRALLINGGAGFSPAEVPRGDLLLTGLGGPRRERLFVLPDAASLDLAARAGSPPGQMQFTALRMR